ncbi:MAG: ATP synthase F1 subunit delta [Candidatus Glassbacteria bacterium]|nr:ATP synthase F1 subunit delta [Candidatus Glassbacteria bacterium]
MSTSAVEKEYAKALFMLAQRTDKIDLIAGQYGELVELIESNRQVKFFLLAPQISAEKKHRLLKKAFEGRIDQHLFKFLQVLIDKRRQNLLSGIYRAYAEQVNIYLNRVEAFAATAVKLTEQEHGALADSLGRHLGCSVMLRDSVDPHLLGGLVCRIGDMVYDGSLRGKLVRLGQQILKEK